MVPEAEQGGFNRTEFLRYLRRLVEVITFTDSDHKVEHVFQAMAFQYTPWPTIDDLEANRQELVQVSR